MGGGGGGEGEVEAGVPGEGEGNVAVLGGMVGTEESGVLALDHVIAIGLQDTAVGAGDAEDFGQHFEIQSEGGPEAFGEPGGIDVHHHVDEGLDLGGLPASPT